MSEKKIMMWMNGKLIEQEKVLLPFMTHALHHGSGVFEGIRIYETPKERPCSVSREHMVRFMDSAKVMCMAHPYTVDELVEATRLAVRNAADNADYIRPLMWYGENDENRIVLNPFKFKVNVAIACAHMGAYLERTTWRRAPSSSHPPGPSRPTPPPHCRPRSAAITSTRSWLR